jgi:hypothetical protein
MPAVRSRESPYEAPAMQNRPHNSMIAPRRLPGRPENRLYRSLSAGTQGSDLYAQASLCREYRKMGLTTDHLIRGPMGP